MELGSKGFSAISLRPGGIWANLVPSADLEDYRKLGFLDESLKPVDSEVFKGKSIPQGANTTIVAAFDPSIGARNGAHMNCEVDDAAVEPYTVDKKMLRSFGSGVRSL